MKDTIENKQGIQVLIEQKNTTEKSRIFCDRIEYIHNKQEDSFDHHLMFYEKGSLIFKVWLRNNQEDKEYRDIYAALGDVGMKVERINF